MLRLMPNTVMRAAHAANANRWKDAMKVICPVCEKVVGAYVPKGGDGSAYRPCRHGVCEGRFELVEEIYQERLPTERTRQTIDISVIRRIIIDNTYVDPDTLSVSGYDKTAQKIVEYCAAQ